MNQHDDEILYAEMNGVVTPFPGNYGWGEQQKQDEDLEKQAITEATNRIYRAIAELELLYNCGLPDLRKDVRFLELVIWRK